MDDAWGRRGLGPTRGSELVGTASPGAARAAVQAAHFAHQLQVYRNGCQKRNMTSPPDLGLQPKPTHLRKDGASSAAQEARAGSPRSAQGHSQARPTMPVTTEKVSSSKRPCNPTPPGEHNPTGQHAGSSSLDARPAGRPQLAAQQWDWEERPTPKRAASVSPWATGPAAASRQHSWGRHPPTLTAHVRAHMPPTPHQLRPSSSSPARSRPAHDLLPSSTKEGSGNQPSEGHSCRLHTRRHSS